MKILFGIFCSYCYSNRIYPSSVTDTEMIGTRTTNNEKKCPFQKCKPMDCWEQVFGSQLYKLVLIDFVALLIASVVQVSCIQSQLFIRNLFLTKCACLSVGPYLCFNEELPSMPFFFASRVLCFVCLFFYISASRELQC